MVDNYRVLGRKYRPKNLKDLVGHPFLVKVLTQGFRQGRLGHSFLFTGTRGVGKTTVARALARLINCEAFYQGPMPEELVCCETCKNCRATGGERFEHLDILELDGASYNSVEDVRDLIQSIQYPPAMGRYKVYIIDEVHMLSKGAFNALLKTLEEPPAYVKFIFATTEFHKIPKTISSRCLCFQMAPIPGQIIQEHLVAVCQKEGLVFQEEALKFLAKKGEGSLRDSLSLLEQCRLALEPARGEAVSLGSIQGALGLPEKEQCQGLLEALLSANGDELFPRLSKMLSLHSPHSVVDGLIEALEAKLCGFDFSKTLEPFFSHSLVCLEALAEWKGQGHPLPLEILMGKLMLVMEMPPVQGDGEVSNCQGPSHAPREAKTQALKSLVLKLQEQKEYILASLVKEWGVRYESSPDFCLEVAPGAPENLGDRVSKALGEKLVQRTDPLGEKDSLERETRDRMEAHPLAKTIQAKAPGLQWSLTKYPETKEDE